MLSSVISPYKAEDVLAWGQDKYRTNYIRSQFLVLESYRKFDCAWLHWTIYGLETGADITKTCSVATTLCRTWYAIVLTYIIKQRSCDWVAAARQAAQPCCAAAPCCCPLSLCCSPLHVAAAPLPFAAVPFFNFPTETQSTNQCAGAVKVQECRSILRFPNHLIGLHVNI